MQILTNVLLFTSVCGCCSTLPTWLRPHRAEMLQLQSLLVSQKVFLQRKMFHCSIVFFWSTSSVTEDRLKTWTRPWWALCRVLTKRTSKRWSRGAWRAALSNHWSRVSEVFHLTDNLTRFYTSEGINFTIYVPPLSIRVVRSDRQHTTHWSAKGCSSMLACKERIELIWVVYNSLPV